MSYFGVHYCLDFECSPTLNDHDLYIVFFTSISIIFLASMPLILSYDNNTDISPILFKNVSCFLLKKYLLYFQGNVFCFLTILYCTPHHKSLAIDVLSKLRHLNCFYTIHNIIRLDLTEFTFCKILFHIILIDVSIKLFVTLII